MEHRSRIWRAVSGLAAAALVTAALVGAAGAAEPAVAGSTYVPVVPCRLFDTRPAPANIGDRASPIGEDETHRQQVTGAVGDCVLPAHAVSVTINLTAARGTTRSFLTVAPAGEPLPNVSVLNWVASAPPTPNQITVGLSSAGAIDLHNEFGAVDLIGDVVGYGSTADLDELQQRLDGHDTQLTEHEARLDGFAAEVLTLNSEFDALDDAVSSKANAADVYTTAVADAIHTPIPMAGGSVDGTGGTVNVGSFSFGNWTPTRVGTGTYRIDMLARGGCSGLPRPYVLVTATEPRIVSADLVFCQPNGNWRFFVNMRNQNVVLTDSDWHFTVFG